MARLMATLLALVLFPLAAAAAPINVSGSYSFDGDANVDPFSFAFDTVLDVDASTEFLDLPLTSGSVQIGQTLFKDSIHLRFATNRLGGFGVLALSQDTSPFIRPFRDFFQISAAFGRGTDINTILERPVSAPLFGFNYMFGGDTFNWGSGTGLGVINFQPVTPVPLPATALMLLSGLGLIAARRKRA